MSKKCDYLQPSSEVIELRQEGVICGSAAEEEEPF